jgi:rhomboid family GlyGly-CTERM serine protease
MGAAEAIPPPRIFLNAMNPPATQITLPALDPKRANSGTTRRIELAAWALLIGVLNLPLLWGGWNQGGAFNLGAVEAGQWWRIVTHPFVHLSWYHLLLDGAAFFLLYSGLRVKCARARLGCLLASATGSLLVSIWAAPEFRELGLCGLSGIAHGLMACSAVEMISGRGRGRRRIGFVFFWLVVLKSGIEAMTGGGAFSWLHFGLMGEPIAVAHAGGVVGGLLACFLPAGSADLKLRIASCN